MKVTLPIPIYLYRKATLHKTGYFVSTRPFRPGKATSCKACRPDQEKLPRVKRAASTRKGYLAPYKTSYTDQDKGGSMQSKPLRSR